MIKEKRMALIIPAAGIGARMNSTIKKQYIEIKGQSILFWTLKNMIEHTSWDELVLVVGSDEVETMTNQLYTWLELIGEDIPYKVVSGGDTRQSSVYCGLKAVSKADYVVIHDGVRPFAKGIWLEQMLGHMIQNDLEGLSVGTQSFDTLKALDQEGIIVGELDRTMTWAVQTPQVFKVPVILEAHEKAVQSGFVGTDDTSLLTRLGYRVGLIEIDRNNIKITTPFELEMAKVLMGD